MKLLQQIVLASACLWIAATLAEAQSLQGTLHNLPDSSPKKCHDVEEKIRVDDDAHIRSMAWDILKKRGYVSILAIDDKERDASFRTETINNMKVIGEYFDIQRLELTGVAADDNTIAPFESRFDARMHPSYLAKFDNIKEKKLRLVPNFVRETLYAKQRAAAKIRDLNEARVEINGPLTERGRQCLSMVKDLYISEIVAHSWGTDIIFNGILEGVIHLPKRVILIGIPSPYVNKWRELARRLPIDVRIYSSDEDSVRKVSTVWGTRNITGFDDPNIYDQEIWGKKVDEYCMRNNNRCRRPEDSSSITFNADMFAELSKAGPFKAGPMRHNRVAYYQYIASNGELSKSSTQMRRDQNKAVNLRMKNERDKAMAEARDILKKSPFKIVKSQICRNLTDEDFKPVVPVAPVTLPEAPASPPIQATPPTPIYRVYDELFDLARIACLFPDELTEDEMRRHLNGFPNNQSYQFSSWNIPSGCVKDLFSELMQFNATWSRNKTLNRNWLIDRASRLNQKHVPQPIYSEDEENYHDSPVYSGPCGNGGSLCGSNRPHFKP